MSRLTATMSERRNPDRQTCFKEKTVLTQNLNQMERKGIYMESGEGWMISQTEAISYTKRMVEVYVKIPNVKLKEKISWRLDRSQGKEPKAVCQHASTQNKYSGLCECGCSSFPLFLILNF